MKWLDHLLQEPVKVPVLQFYFKYQLHMYCNLFDIFHYNILVGARQSPSPSRRSASGGTIQNLYNY